MKAAAATFASLGPESKFFATLYMDMKLGRRFSDTDINTCQRCGQLNEHAWHALMHKFAG